MIRNEKNIYIAGESVISSLGFGSQEHTNAIRENRTGIQKRDFPALGISQLPVGAIAEELIRDQFSRLHSAANLTRFEMLLVRCVEEALQGLPLQLSDPDTRLIISTTKGNVDLIGNPKDKPKLYLSYSANRVASYLEVAHQPLVVSNACISGVLAMLHAQRLIRQGRCKHAVVVGADVLSDFVVSGFHSFRSLSQSVCAPFDKDRDGLNLGEAAACVVLSSVIEGDCLLSGGASANDANHISGPSRTGEGLFQAIRHAASEESLSQLDYVSAHGTATPYNDDMESVAMHRAGLSHVPVNSFKGYVGHTLGAAGLVETILAMSAMRTQSLPPTLGFRNPGTIQPLQVITKNQPHRLKTVLKLASGFGGCNAAMIVKKYE